LLLVDVSIPTYFLILFCITLDTKHFADNMAWAVARHLHTVDDHDVRRAGARLRRALEGPVRPGLAVRAPPAVDVLQVVRLTQAKNWQY
jgi:hypothetical protein